MDIWYYLMVPFTFLLKLFYGIFNSYGVAIILFSLAIKVVLFPLSLKGKRGMIQMNMLNGKIQKLQKQYGKDQQRYQMEVQKLYEKEGANPMGGCLWSFIPLFILFPVYAVVRRPLKYWLGLGNETIGLITSAVTGAGVTLNSGYPEISIFSELYKSPSLLATVQTAVPDVDIYGINFSFLGIDLSATPSWKFWANGISWASIGLVLVPVLCAVTAFLSSQIMMKTNQMGNQNEQVAQQSKMMMWLSPLMMLWFGVVMPAGMGVYIISNSVFTTVQELICGKMLKKDYEQAAEAARLREIEEKEEEKRLRREKAEQRAREAEEARRNKGKKKEKDPDEARMTPEQKAASRVGMRQYARGRAYDPDRFGGVTPYHEDLAKQPAPVEEEEPVEGEFPAAEEAPVVIAPPAESGEPALDTELEELNAELDAAMDEAGADESKED